MKLRRDQLLKSPIHRGVSPISAAALACLLATGGFLCFLQPSLGQESFRLGPFGVRSSVSESVNFTDNINNTPGAAEKESDIWFSTFTGFEATTRMLDRHTLGFAGGVGFSKHLDHPQLDNITPFTFNSRLALDYDPLKINFSDNFAYTSSALDQLFAAGVAKAETYRNSVDLGADYNPRPWRAGMQYYHSNIWYGAASGQAQFNAEPKRRDLVIPSVGYSHFFPRGYVGLLGVEYRYLDATDRREKSIRLNAGFSGALTPQIDFNLGGNFALTGTPYYRSTMAFHTETVQKMKFRIEAGAVATQQPGSNQLRFSPEVLATATQQLTEKTTHGLNAQISLSDPLSAQQSRTNTSYSNAWIASYHIDHHMADPLTLGFMTSYSRLQSVIASVNEKNTTWTATPSLSYKLTQQWSFSLRYSFTQRRSDITNRKYERNDIGLMATYTF